MPPRGSLRSPTPLRGSGSISLRLVLVAVVLSGAGATAHADEDGHSLELVGVGAGATSTWDDDGALLASGRAGLRFGDRVGIQLFTLAGYAGVNHRALTGFGAGGQLWSELGRGRPYVRGGVLWLDEQPLANFEDHPLDAMLGLGDGVTRRFGVVAAVGIDLPLLRLERAEVFATAELAVLALRDDGLGPRSYTLLGAGLGVRFGLAPTSPSLAAAPSPAPCPEPSCP